MLQVGRRIASFGRFYVRVARIVAALRRLTRLFFPQMMSNVNTLSSLERQDRIVQFLQRRRRATVAELAAQFAISSATVRRDLDILAEQGEVERFHGGARVSPAAPPELPVMQRETQQAREKAAIGALAASLVVDGETVCLGSGTTALQVAYHLRRRQDLTVITNSLPVVNALADLAGITVVALGGILRQSEQSFIGHLTERALQEVHAAKVIMGIHAIDLEHGLTNDYLSETMTDRALLRVGREAIIVADYTKLGRVSTAFVAPLSAMTTLVTDERTPGAFLQSLRDLGIRVLPAPYLDG